MQITNSPFLITVEGLDGAGKTTFAQCLAQAIKTKNQPVWLVNGVDYALSNDQKKEHYYLLPRDQKQEFWINSFSLLAQKCWQKTQVNSSSNPTIIICDRWYDSAIVYQGRSDQWLTMLTKRSKLEKQLKPQLKFLIKTPLPLIKKRWLAKGNHDWRENLFDMFWNLYYKVMGKDRNTVIVDGEKSIPELIDQARRMIKQRIKEES